MNKYLILFLFTLFITTGCGDNIPPEPTTEPSGGSTSGSGGNQGSSTAPTTANCAGVLATNVRDFTVTMQDPTTKCLSTKTVKAESIQVAETCVRRSNSGITIINADTVQNYIIATWTNNSAQDCKAYSDSNDSSNHAAICINFKTHGTDVLDITSAASSVSLGNTWCQGHCTRQTCSM